MRLRRIHLQNVRGVVDRELLLTDAHDTTGVVVIEGPNEAGKSTIGDALDVLLTSKASSRSADVRSLQTAGVDDGPHIEVDLDIGTHRLTYRKRFLRRPVTELTISLPRGEQYSGDEAHDRVTAILDEELDMALWRALRFTQRDPQLQPALADASGLATALRTHGSASAIGDRELWILERARSEYERFYTTAKGSPKPVLRDSEDAVSRARADLDAVDVRLDELDADVRETAHLEQEVPRLRLQLEQAQQRASELVARRRDVDERRAEHRRAQESLAATRRAADHLDERGRRRHQQARDLTELGTQRDDLRRRLADAESAERSMASRLDAARQALEHATALRQAARAAREAAETNLEVLRARADVDDLERRRDSAASATALLHEATAEHARLRVDDDALDRLHTAQRRVDVTVAARDAASPQLRFTAADALAFEIDGQRHDLAAGATSQWPVRGSMTLRLPVGDVEVRSGEGGHGAEQAAREAADELDALLAQLGVADVAEAGGHHRRRSELAIRIDELTRQRDVALDGGTPEHLESQIARLRDGMRAAGRSPTDGDLPGDIPRAERELAEAIAAQDTADDALAAPATEVDELRGVYDARRGEVIDLRGRADEVRRRAEILEAELAEQRAAVTDDLLHAEAADARTELAAMEQRQEATAERLAQFDAQGVTELADNAVAVADDLRKQVDATVADLRESRTAIRIRGGEGLWELREQFDAELAAAQADSAAIHRRARAARRLYDTLHAHRAAAQQRYAQPFRDQVLRFGRMLFGSGFDIELDEDLKVRRRHLDGVWLEFGQLSAGAQEQLAMLTRLACGRLLHEQGGLLFFDDALGNTDPQRLEAIGAVLRLAGEHTQVLILTCTPDRFRHVGGAKRVSLT